MKLEKEVAVLSKDNSYLRQDLERKQIMIEQSQAFKESHKKENIREIYQEHEREVSKLSHRIH